MKYFNSNHNSYYAQNQNAYPGAVSYGVPHQQVLATGPDLNPGYANQQGGGVMPAEFYGNNSGRYFEAGAPELSNMRLSLWCNSPNKSWSCIKW